jgi:ankyrin repeat protein
LRLCVPASVRRILAELPETLDETYERILQEIPKSNNVHAHRLLQCLTVAVRPLRLEELAEVLAVDFGTSDGVPKLNEALRWEDQEKAVLSACSGLIAVVEGEDSRVVQFSHFSVKEFLTSDRLSTSKIDTSRYHHIRLEPAHTIMAQACLAVLLTFDSDIDEASIENFPLARYAAEHFGDHVEFKDVLSNIRGGVGHLLDADKTHFAAWLRMLGPDFGGEHPHKPRVTPLHYVAQRGYHGLVDYLISKRPEDVNFIGEYGTPLHAALDGRHANVAQLLLGYCIDVDVRDSREQTPLHLAAAHGFVRVTCMLVERKADINARDSAGRTPLHRTMLDLEITSEDRHVNVAEFLLKHGADRNTKNDGHSNALHHISHFGFVKAAKLLLRYKANVHVRDEEGHTPLHRVFVGLYDSNSYMERFLDVIRLLLEHGAKIDALNNNHATPLHVAAYYGSTIAARRLLEHGANVHLRDSEGKTPFEVASTRGSKELAQLLSGYLQSGQNTS